MRVLFNTYPVAFACPGGGEIQLRKLAQALECAGVEIVLYDPWKPDFEGISLVHYFSVQSGSMNFCDYAKRQGLKLIISPLLWLTDENVGDLPMDQIRDLLHLCDVVVVNSSAETEQLSTAFELDANKFAVVYNGVDKSFAGQVSSQLFRKKFGIDEPFLLNVANIEPRKNQLRLVEAAKELGLKLVVLGHIRDRSYFDECKRRAGDVLVCPGYIDHDSELLKSAYRACEVFVLPSLMETPGLAALEAAVCGAKVVVTKVGSAKEYFGQRVRYADPLDPRDIKEAIGNQLNTDLMTDLREHVLSNFTWNKAGEQTIDAYRLAMAAKTEFGE